MSSGEPSTAATEATATVPTSTDFCADDADVIIRAGGTLDFRVHKLILSLVSPIFKDMFTLPQPPPDTPNALPRIDVQDSAKAWENILRTIYPNQPNPTIDTLDDLESLLLAAQTYEMQSIIETHRKAFEHRKFIEKDPLRLYTIACACGFEDEVAYVARNAELLAVTRHSDPHGMKGLTFCAYYRLVSFLVDRDNQWLRFLDNVRVPQCNDCCGNSMAVYGNIKKNLRRPYLRTEEVYLKALEDRTLGLQGWCPQIDCPLREFAIKRFVEEKIAMREKVCDEFQPTSWYLNTALRQPLR